MVDYLSKSGAAGVYVDGGRVIQAFIRADLIDELTLSTAPVLLGSGIPLFGDLDDDVRLIHAGTATHDSGMVSTRYLVHRQHGTEHC